MFLLKAGADSALFEVAFARQKSQLGILAERGAACLGARKAETELAAISWDLRERKKGF